MALFEYICALPAPIVSLDADFLFTLDFKPITRVLNRLENALSDPEVKGHVASTNVVRKMHKDAYIMNVTILLDSQRAHYILETGMMD